MYRKKTCIKYLVAIVFQRFFIWKYIKISFFICKKLFLISAHQNNLKTSKNINMKQRKNKKILIFSKAFLKHKNR